MTVYVFPADEYACGYFRMIWPAQALRSQGYGVEIVRPTERSRMIQGVLKGDRLVDVKLPADADVIVLQRITHRYLVDAIPIMRAKGVAVVIDMDDDLSRIHPANPAFMSLHPQHGSPDHNWHNSQKACERATAVTLSTTELLPRYASHGRGTVIQNCVPAAYLKVPHSDAKTVGWGGALFSHPDDLPVVGNAIDQLTRGGVSFWVIGPGTGVKEAIHLTVEPYTTGVMDLLTQWPHAIAALGIGIAPLADSKFNTAKSWLKPLEYAALGVPCVMSPRREYVKLHKRGVGLLASKPRDWLRHLRFLVDNDDARVELAERGRDSVRDLTIEENAYRWWEVWMNALKQERQGKHALLRNT